MILLDKMGETERVSEVYRRIYFGTSVVDSCQNQTL